MAKIDKLKEKMGILKFWLGIVVATFLALIGWSVTNYKSADIIILIASVVCMVLALVAIYILNRKMNVLLDEIERN
ncbi:hypothetical protein [Campylobacter helveticus]|uniref:hypothetical protein n=1 Tax=Campylobacter helveticus TaxID=28898 RepID=UPI0022EAB02C|nr:hypothetical protein [Campylobacter helveticus]